MLTRGEFLKFYLREIHEEQKDQENLQPSALAFQATVTAKSLFDSKLRRTYVG